MRRILAAFLLPALFLATACGDDDGAGVDPTPTATGTAASNGTTPTPAPTGELAEILARRPAYFIYEVATGDTLASITGMFGGADAGLLPEDLRILNQLPPGDVEPGQLLAIPLAGYDAVAMMPEAAMVAALGIGEGSHLALLRPTGALRDELYLGRIALHRVRLVPPDTGVQPGYLLEFAETDRAAFKGGEIDEDARTGPMAFIVAAGSLAGDIEPPAGGTIHRFEIDGVSYAVVAPARGPEAEAIAALLEALGGP